MTPSEELQHLPTGGHQLSSKAFLVLRLPELLLASGFKNKKNGPPASIKPLDDRRRSVFMRSSLLTTPSPQAARRSTGSMLAPRQRTMERPRQTTLGYRRYLGGNREVFPRSRLAPCRLPLGCVWTDTFAPLLQVLEKGVVQLCEQFSNVLRD